MSNDEATLPPQLNQALFGAMWLYFLGILTSMAAMEIFSTLIALFMIVTYTVLRFQRRGSIPIPFRIGPDLPLLALFCVTFLGALWTPSPTARTLDIIGKVRWIPLLYLLTYALLLLKPYWKRLSYLLVLTGPIAIYGIFQHFTGIDLLRNGHRAVQPMQDLWRTAGLYSSPMSYGYLFGQLSCILLAGHLLLIHHKGSPKIKWGLLTLFLLVAISLGTTMTRGVWLASLLTYGFIILLSHRKLFWKYLALILIALTLILSTNSYRNRLTTAFDPSAKSVSERFDIWRANLAMFQEHPLLGVGYGENEKLIPTYFQKLGIQNGFQGHAHNTFLHFLSGTGIIGFAAFLLFLLASFRNSWRLYHTLPHDHLFARTLHLSVMGALLFLTIGGLTENVFQDAETRHALLALLALTFAHSFTLSRK